VKSSRLLALLTVVLVCAADLIVGPAAVATHGAWASAAGPAAYVVPVDRPLSHVVVDRSGHAFAANPQRDRVEELSTTTAILEAPIAVGSNPVDLDLSADQTTLYVANALSNDISVVDVAQRREVRRIALPPAPNGGQPFSIAVAANNTALLTRVAYGSTSEGVPTLSVDLVTGIARERHDWNFTSMASDRIVVRASGDHTRIAIARQEGSSQPGGAGFYTASSDTFTPVKALAHGSMLAVDATGSKMLVGPDTSLLDGDLVLRGTVPGPDSRALAVQSSGATAYRMQERSVDVIDVVRALVVGSVALPDTAAPDRSGALALTADGATLVAVTGRGFSVTGVGAPSPIGCTSRPAPAPPAVVSVCGAPLADVAIDGRGRAYASNTARNQIEVVALATRTLEAPILVGSQPTSIDLSPDGNTLYVADSGAEEISVVDLSVRREVRRITVSSIPDAADRPASIAVAANGTVLLATRPLNPSWYPGRLLQVDLSTGAVRVREDFPDAGPAQVPGSRPQYLAASADGSRIAATPGGALGGDVFVYIAATDSFTHSKELANTVSYLALDKTGSKVLAGRLTLDGFEGATVVLDRDLLRRATIPTGGSAEAVNAPGTTSYRRTETSIEILDLDRDLIRGRLALPEPASGPGAIAVTPDESTIAVLTPSGVSVVSVAGATGVGCAARTVPATVTAICGAPLGEMVVDRTGMVYASNPQHNEIDVVSLATGALQPPIPVGSRPRGLDLSADGKTLYVADSGAEEISVVDLTRRVESRRITVPSRLGGNDRPFSIAVGDRGIALYSTTGDGGGVGGSIYQLDLRSETARLRDDMGTSGARTGMRTAVVASADRSRIVVADTDTSGGDVFVYTAGTDAFSPLVNLDRYLQYVGVDGTGSRFVFDAGGLVSNRDLQTEGEIPSGGYGVAVNRAGTIAYRVQFNSVEVLDLDRRMVTQTIPLPEPLGLPQGAIALSPDETTLAVLTNSGMTRLQIKDGPPQTPYSTWSQPAPTPLDGVGTWIAVANTPTAAPGQTPPAFLYAHYFGFAASSAIGAVALVASPAGKAALFTVTAPDGTPASVAIPFSWSGGHFYYTLVYQMGPGSWGAWIYDLGSGIWKFVGQLHLPGEWGKLSPSTMTMAMWLGGTVPNCSAYPRADVYFSTPVGYVGTTTTNATLGATRQTPGTCPASTSVESGTWVHYRLGV